MKQHYISPTQVAKALGISRQAVIDKIRKGSINAARAGRQYIVDKKELAHLKKKGY